MFNAQDMYPLESDTGGGHQMDSGASRWGVTTSALVLLST